MPKSSARHTDLQLSVILVNYNVREFLDHALASIQKAMKGIRGEIIVVDNASDDGSVQMLQRRYPEVLLIASKTNLGFARANNLALSRARGKYLLLINPDTIVQEDTLRVMLKFFEEHPEVGLAGCKILNPDGTFQLACRRSFPTPWVAFTKVIGLGALFPSSKLFGKYNLTYLNPDAMYEVDAVSGSFMLLRRDVYESVGGLDEDFFMYGEDLDWCYRIQRSGKKIYYVPLTQIIHYKGESTKRSSINEIKTFYEAMYLFVRKHFRRSMALYLFLHLGIFLSSSLARIASFLRPIRMVIFDFLLVDVALMVAEYIWRGEVFSFAPRAYSVVYTVPAAIVVWSLSAAGVYTHRRMSVSRTMAGIMMSYLVISATVAFFRDYAFSRAVIVLSGALSLLLLPGWRLLVRLYGKSSPADRRGLFERRTLIVGTDGAAQEIHKRIRMKVGDGYEVLGFIDTSHKRLGEKVSGLPILGSSDNVAKVIDEQRVSDVIFSAQTLSYKDILTVISRAGGHAVNFHIVPNTMDVIIGKASVDSLGGLPLVPISYNIEKLQNRAWKRLFDIAVSTFLLISVYPFVYLKHTIKSTPRSRALLSLPSVLSGKLSLVGPPMGYASLAQTNGKAGQSIFIGKPGMTGLVQLQSDRALTPEEIEQYGLYYARNQSLLLDIEIILKTIFRSKSKSVDSLQELSQATTEQHRTFEKGAPRPRKARRNTKGAR
ncbi:MAG: glycosyltransferase [Ignavibacteriae bacterium]|nr:glycosyltransferase [Ignavibacteriota bacterium]